MFSVSFFRKVRHNAHNEKRAKLPKLTIWHEKSCGSGHKKKRMAVSHPLLFQMMGKHQNFAILMAKTAQSLPLLPWLPPARSCACCKSLVVSRP